MSTTPRSTPPPITQMRYRITHATRYLYSEAVPLCQNELHVRPRDTVRQTCRAHHLTIDPRPNKVEQSHDYFGNAIQFFTIQDRHQELSVTAHSEIELQSVPVLQVEKSPTWELVSNRARQGLGKLLDVRQYLYESPHVPTFAALEQYAAVSFAKDRRWLEAVLDLTTRIHREFTYDPTATSVSTPLDTVLEMRRGVCQDFAHLQIGCLRAMGLPARYVSGYLLTLPPPGQPRLIGADASHAWVSAWSEEFGWVDFDPTNNLVPSLEHITVAWGRDYSDVCPIKGVFIGGGDHAMNVSVDVQPI